MKGFWQNLPQRVTDTWMVRRVADALLRSRGRRHLAQLDHTDPVRAQLRVLRGLVHQASSTPFGRRHDFARIRTAADFQRLVPLTTADELLAPLPAAVEASHRTANLTAMALAQRATAAELCTGSVVFLDDAFSATEFEQPAANARKLPWLARPYAIAESTLTAIARAAARTATTCLAGSVSALLRLLAEVKRLCRRERLLEVWPNLRAVLFARKQSDPSPALLREEVGPEVVLIETVSRHGAPIAVEDPATGLLRWLPDHGVFFEFIPVEHAASNQPPRLLFDQLDTGADYELVATSPTGLWARRLGEKVHFERRDTPLFRMAPLAPQVIASAPRQMTASGQTEEEPVAPRQHPGHLGRGPLLETFGRTVPAAGHRATVLLASAPRTSV